MKDFLRKWLDIEPEIIEREVFVEKEVIKEMPTAKVGEILDGLQEQLSGRSVVLTLAAPNATDYERGRIKGQIEMLSKVMLGLAYKDGEES